MKTQQISPIEKELKRKKDELHEALNKVGDAMRSLDHGNFKDIYFKVKRIMVEHQFMMET